MARVSNVREAIVNNLNFFACLYFFLSFIAFLLRHIISFDYVLVLFGAFLLIILFNKKPSLFIKYLFLIFMCIFMLSGLFICEHFNVNLYELATLADYHGSFPLAVMYWIMVLSSVVYFDRKISDNSKYDDNRSELTKYVLRFHLEKLLPEKFRSNKDENVKNLSMIIYGGFFIIGLVLLLYVLFNIPIDPSADRFMYERMLPGWITKIQTYYVYCVPILFVPILLCRKKLDYKHIIAMFSSILPFLLYSVRVGNKFGVFFNIFTLILISFVVYVLNNGKIYNAKRNNSIYINSIQEDKFRDRIIRLLTITFISIIVLLIPYYIIRGDNISESIFGRVAQQGQLWWSVFEKNENGSMHLSEFDDEIKPLFRAGSVRDTEYNHGVYKIMNITTPQYLVKSKLASGSRYSCQGIELAFYYFGYVGIIIHAILRGLIEVLLITLLIKFLYSFRLISVIITARLLMLNHAVFSQGDWFLVFSYKTLFTIGVLLILSYLYRKYLINTSKVINLKKAPLISVVVPVYNQEKYLNFCLDSILEQTYKNLEIILVNDGSTDSSTKILEEYSRRDSRIKIINKKNEGVSVARNYGIKKATGEYIAFVDSDDWIHPKMYEYLYRLIIEYNVDISICSFHSSNDNKITEFSNDENITLYHRDEYLQKYFKIECQDTEYYPWNKLYKRDLIESNQFPAGIACGEDVLGTYKAIIKADNVVKSSREAYYYRENLDSVSRNFSKKDYDVIKVWDMMVDYNKNQTPEYLEYSILNKKRTNFTILYRLARNYSSDELRKMNIVEKLLSQLKKDEKYLLKSKIVLSRKIIIFLFCRNYYFFAKFL